jgi:hypothetical protein
MFYWLKTWLVAWAEDRQRREIARLQEESKRLTEEVEPTTGEPFRLTPEERRRLAKKAKGIDPNDSNRSHRSILRISQSCSNRLIRRRINSLRRLNLNCIGRLLIG